MRASLHQRDPGQDQHDPCPRPRAERPAPARGPTARPLADHNLVGGLTLGGTIAPFVLDGPINRPAFETHVDKFLVPERRAGDIVVMDNPCSHKGPAVRENIEADGAELLFLPPCGPDLNPI